MHSEENESIHFFEYCFFFVLFCFFQAGIILLKVQVIELSSSICTEIIDKL